VGLTQLVRFLIVELTHLCSNMRFGMCVIFITNILSMVRDIFIDNEMLLVNDFINI
jgi:hypothetical protein